MKSLLILSLSLLTITVTNAQQSEMTDKLCGKVKTCAMEQVGADIPPEMMEMMQGMFDGMCATMLAEQYAEIDRAGLEKEAGACVDSFMATSCETMMAAEGNFTTPACDEFKEAADAAGIDVGN